MKSDREHNIIAWRIVKEKAKAHGMRTGFAKKVFWRSACKLSYNVIKFPVFYSKEIINKEIEKL